MAAVEIKTERGPGESTIWWNNFIAYAIHKQNEEGWTYLTFSFVNNMLNEYSGKIVFNNDDEYVRFESEEDATAFILKWS